MQSSISLTVGSILVVILLAAPENNIRHVPNIAHIKPDIPFSCGYSEGIHGEENCQYEENVSAAPNQHAEKAVDMILNPLGLKREDFTLVPCSSVDNAVATVRDGRRIIFYNDSFMATINNRSHTNWASVSILAHEVGHHLKGHPLRLVSQQESRANELAADEFSGFAMFRLNRPLTDAQAALSTIPDIADEARSDYPKKWRRLGAVKEGYENARAQGINVPADQPLVEIRKNEISQASGWQGTFGYVYRGAGVRLTAPDSNDVQHQQDSSLLLLEDGAPLTPHSQHADIQRKGKGLYSHWSDGRAIYLMFSTSDNSDPRVNGKKYVVTVNRQ